jgi:hypothetical protein
VQLTKLRERQLAIPMNCCLRRISLAAAFLGIAAPVEAQTAEALNRGELIQLSKTNLATTQEVPAVAPREWGPRGWYQGWYGGWYWHGDGAWWSDKGQTVGCPIALVHQIRPGCNTYSHTVIGIR